MRRQERGACADCARMVRYWPVWRMPVVTYVWPFGDAEISSISFRVCSRTLSPPAEGAVCAHHEAAAAAAAAERAQQGRRSRRRLQRRGDAGYPRNIFGFAEMILYHGKNCESGMRVLSPALRTLHTSSVPE